MISNNTLKRYMEVQSHIECTKDVTLLTKLHRMFDSMAEDSREAERVKRAVEDRDRKHLQSLIVLEMENRKLKEKMSMYAMSACVAEQRMEIFEIAIAVLERMEGE